MTRTHPSADSREHSLLERLSGGALVALLGLMIRLAEVAGIARTLRIGAAFGRFWRVVGGPRTRRVRAQLAAAFPEIDSTQRGRWEEEVFSHLGLGLGELVVMAGRHRKEMLSRVDVVGLEHLDRAVRQAAGKGAVVIAPHLGNWELYSLKLASLGVPMAVVYRSQRPAALERAVRRIRSGVDPARPVQALDEPVQQIALGHRAGVQFLRALGDGRNVFVLLDQHAGRDEGLLVSFFGRPASTRFGPLTLAERAGAPVLIAAGRRDADGIHHRVTFLPALQLEPGSPDDVNVLRRNLQRVTAEIEKEIRASPGQWIWTHRRWRGQPDSGVSG